MSIITTPKIIENLSEGLHKGEIKKVELTKHKDYEYIVFEIETEDGKNIYHSVPNSTSSDREGNPKSGLAIILKALGFNIAEPVDVELSVGKKIQFMSKNKQTDKGTFPRVLTETIGLVA